MLVAIHPLDRAIYVDEKEATAESVMAQPECHIGALQQDCLHEEACMELQDLHTVFTLCVQAKKYGAPRSVWRQI